MNLFISTVTQDPFYYFAWVGVVAFSICVHEYSHARSALLLGDDTAARLGHLSLNPLVQMGPVSLAMLFLLGIAWGAVPVNTANLRGRREAALVSASGPISNLLLSVAFAGVSIGLGLFSVDQGAMMLMQKFFHLGSVANGVLFALNMLPVPMLDGWPVFALLFPRMREISPQQVQTLSWVFLLVIFFTPLWSLIWTGGSLMAAYFMQSWLRLFSLFL